MRRREHAMPVLSMGQRMSQWPTMPVMSLF